MGEPAEEYVTVNTARKLLGVSTNKMAAWIREGLLPTTDSPFNKRAKLVRLADVERLLAAPRPKPIPVAV